MDKGEGGKKTREKRGHFVPQGDLYTEVILGASNGPKVLMKGLGGEIQGTASSSPPLTAHVLHPQDRAQLGGEDPFLQHCHPSAQVDQ